MTCEGAPTPTVWGTLRTVPRLEGSAYGRLWCTLCDRFNASLEVYAEARSTWGTSAAMGHECLGSQSGSGRAWALRTCAGGAEARRICRVVTEDPGRVVLHTRVGSHRLLERLSGEQLPRIC